MKNLRRATVMLYLLIFSSTFTAYCNSLIEQIYLNLPDSSALVTKAERKWMIQGGLNADTNEPVDSERYPKGVLIQKGSNFYVYAEIDALWDAKVLDTDNQDEKIVYIQHRSGFTEIFQHFYKYNVKSNTLTALNAQLPTLSLDDVMDAKITAANRTEFKNDCRNYIFRNLDVEDNTIWMDFNTELIDNPSFPKETRMSCYAYWDGSRFVKPEKKINNVTTIRNEYNEVKKHISDTKAKVYDKTVTTSKKQVAAIGEQTRTYTLYHNAGKLVFATQQFNVAARNYYDEYLFDKNGKLRFCYRRFPTYDGDTVELRFYFENGRLIKSLIKVKKAGEQQFSTKYEGQFMPTEWWFEYQDALANMRKTVVGDFPDFIKKLNKYQNKF